MTAWTMNAVSVAEPSVWHQLMSRGTLRKRKYLTPADEARALLEPVERIQRSASRICSRRPGRRRAISGEAGSGRATPRCRPRAGRALQAGSCGSSRQRRARRPRRREYVLPRQRRPFSDPRTRSGRERVPAGRRCGSPRCRTGRRGRGSRSRPRQRVGMRSTPFSVFFSSSSGRPLVWTGQPRWTQRLERTVKLGAPSSRPLLRMYAVRRVTSPSSGRGGRS